MEKEPIHNWLLLIGEQMFFVPLEELHDRFSASHHHRASEMHQVWSDPTSLEVYQKSRLLQQWIAQGNLSTARKYLSRTLHRAPLIHHH